MAEHDNLAESGGWFDDAEDMKDAASVSIAWVAYDDKGAILFNSDDSISGAQAEAMFRAIGAAEVEDDHANLNALRDYEASLGMDD